MISFYPNLMLTLVKEAGFTQKLSLTSSQAPTRARGVQLLSEVLKECYGELTEREVEVLIAFYENRLKDHYVITPPVLQGLRALVSPSVIDFHLCPLDMFANQFEKLQM
uniref:MMS19 nucleotide excision repair protein n=1 Tax=Acanthochromis polyacanthus TaxID=80966 RepID=A0A3Q1F1Y7_9TELE